MNARRTNERRALGITTSPGTTDSLHQLSVDRESHERILRRFDRKPKRLVTRRRFVLQGLPGVGLALAHRLLCRFGSIERIVTVGRRHTGRSARYRRKEGVSESWLAIHLQA